MITQHKKRFHIHFQRLKLFKSKARRKLRRSFISSPGRIPVLGFLMLILVGAILLRLPVSANGSALTFLEALFTSTSAVCVTGLSVIDVGTRLSGFGQGVLLALIQVGGLGIMTLSTLVLLMIRGRASLMEKELISDTYTHSGQWRPSTIVRDVFRLTLIIEGAGALILFLRFSFEMHWLTALSWGVFHSISAFCNAGFALFPDSLMAFQGDIVVNFTTITLIVLGGIGFLVISELTRLRPRNKRQWRRLSLHTKIVLSATLFLLVAGFFCFLAMEWDNTLSGLPFYDRLLAAVFQSATLRTAGFNTLPLSELANETLFISLIFMLIGASPGSCGGGIKTTTFATLMLLGISRIRGKQQPQAFYRAISLNNVARATQLVMVSMLIVGVGIILLLMTEVGEAPQVDSRGTFVEIIFEAVSAFATVGLSMDLTSRLSIPGRLIIIVLMFIGRLGPLLVAMALSRTQPSKISLAEENIMIG